MAFRGVSKEEIQTPNGVVGILPVQLIIIGARSLAVNRQLSPVVVAEAAAACGHNSRCERDKVGITKRYISDFLTFKVSVR